MNGMASRPLILYRLLQWEQYHSDTVCVRVLKKLTISGNGYCTVYLHAAVASESRPLTHLDIFIVFIYCDLLPF